MRERPPARRPLNDASNGLRESQTNFPGSDVDPRGQVYGPYDLL